MIGNMMDRPLTLDVFLEHGGRYFGKQEIVSRTLGGIHRYHYSDFYSRTKQLANALLEWGVKDGERVATFCWNHYQHLELYFGVPITGAVTHTVNLRLFAEQIVYIFNHAQDRILFIDRSLYPMLMGLMDKLPLLKTIVLIGEGDDPEVPPGKELVDYEDFIRGHSADFDYPKLDENSACGLCYTSGTTGDPKGVMYTHRSTVLHTLGVGLAASLAITSYDSLLPVVPMFHANAWGTPYASVMVGAKLVLPGPKMDPPSLVELMLDENVTISAGVPTIWAGILEYLDKEKIELPLVKRMAVGGSAAPVWMIQGYKERYGIDISHAWGMTETSPLGTLCAIKPHLPQSGPEHYAIRSTQGFPIPLVEIKAIDEQGKDVPWDGESMGDLVTRGPWIAGSYYKNEAASQDLLTEDGWMRTGDVVTIDGEGYMKITDRAKDLIKSGGEWISSVDLENTLMGHPGVREAAVIAMPDPKWQERPLAYIVAAADKAPTAEQLNEYLAKHFAKWQLPDTYQIIEEVPKTSVGKFDKKALRVLAREKGIIKD